MLIGSLMWKDYREVQSSEARKKLDCVQAMENVSSIEDAKRLKSGMECDLRKSLAWDSAFFTSPGVLDPEELFETLNIREEDVAVDVYDIGSSKTLPPVSFEPERTSTASDCNARTSLAWDSAFLTNAGVLDAEELFLVNSGFSKTEAHTHPEIKEVLWKSADSSSAVKGSRFSVASIEIDLFDDLRASLRTSGTKLDAKPSFVEAGKGTGMKDIQFLKESNASAQRKLKPLLPPGRHRTITHRQVMIQKEPSLNPQAQKPPKGLHRANTSLTAPMNRTLVPKHVKAEHRSSEAEHGRTISMNKKPCLREKPGSTPTQNLPSSCYSVYDPSNKSPVSGLRRKADSRLTASDSSFKTPSRYGNVRNEFLSSSQPSSLLSTPKSSRASSASSTDGWSSDSATSLNHRSCDSTTNSDMNTCRTVLFDTEGSPMKRNPVSDSGLKDIKPSGLRMPLPTIGFFDAENSKKGNREVKFHSGVEAANKRRLGKSRYAFPKEAQSSSEFRARNDASSEKSCRKDSKAEEKRIQGHLKGKMGMRITDKNAQRATRLSSREYNGLGCRENKENILGFENQVGGLGRDIESLDLNGDLVIELKAERVPSH